MLRSLVGFIKSPVHTFPALAAAIGCLVSGYSTFNGIAEIFPNFGYSILAALGLAAIIQLGMLTSTLAFRERAELRPMLGFIIAVTVLMSSFTSYVFYYRGFSEETIAKERQVVRQESLRRYLVDVRSQTAGALGTLQEAEAELQQRIDMEQTTGGGLRNLSNPYLQKIVGQSALSVDVGTVQSGAGDRYRFLTSVLPRVQQMQVELGGSLQRLDAELAVLADENVTQESLRAVYSRASAVVPVDRIREVRGDFLAPGVDAAILDTRPLEEEEYWQRAVAQLAVERSPSAIVFGFIAVFIDLMIVFFAFIAGESSAAQAAEARLPLRHWMGLAYGPSGPEPVRRWLGALDGARVARGDEMLHRVDLRHLSDPTDRQCARFLRQDGYLRQVMLEDGEAHWWLTDGAYGGLLDIARDAASAQEQAASASQEAEPEPAVELV